MKLLLVLAHPLEDSFTAAIATVVRDTLVGNGHSVDWLDLYREGFDPCLTADERRSYYADPYDASAVAEHVDRLRAAEGLVLVFPQWWFSFPAILKGYFDRVLAPGIAFEHRANGGIEGRLTNIRVLFALTTTGSPWWVIRLILGDPVRRVLKRGIGSLCAKRLKFVMLTMYDLDRSTRMERERHLGRVRHVTSTIPHIS